MTTYIKVKVIRDDRFHLHNYQLRLFRQFREKINFVGGIFSDSFMELRGVTRGIRMLQAEKKMQTRRTAMKKQIKRKLGATERAQPSILSVGPAAKQVITDPNALTRRETRNS